MRPRVGTLARAIILTGIAAGGAVVCEAAFGNCGTHEPLTPENCKNAEETLHVCGRHETFTRLCAFPVVTPAMREEALKHDELRDEYHRINSCVSTDPVCEANADKFGGSELVDEVQSSMGNDTPSKIRFHISVTDVDLKKARDDMALVSHKGFTRDMAVNYLLYRTHDDRKFNEDAEGIDLVAKGVVDREREELLKLAAVLADMKELFAQRKDKESEKNTEGFELIARNRALELEAASCEFKRLAYKNRRIENRHLQITLDAAKETYGQGSPGSPAPSTQSDITGVAPDPSLPNPGTTVTVGTPSGAETPRTSLSAVESGGAPIAAPAPAERNNSGSSVPPPSATGASSPGRAPASEQEALLESFGPDPDALRREFQEVIAAPAGIKEEEYALFDRVRRHLRGRYQHGEFRPSVVD